MRQRAITGALKKTGVFAALILLLLVPAARADPGFTLEDVTTWHWGFEAKIWSVAVGDVDGDPAVEIVTGGYYYNSLTMCDVAQLCVWDGSTLALEDVKTWYWVGRTHITSVAIGDVDDDGSVEIVTGGGFLDGKRNNAQLAVWDGSTLALEGVKTWYWVDATGISSVAIGDVDGDGQTEIVTGGYYWDGMRDVAQLCVWEGSTLALEDVKTWYWVSYTYIFSVACADVDRDPAVEIVTGGRYVDGTKDIAQLCVWDGATLSLERVKTWCWEDHTFIGSVACADVDNDGAIEIITGGHYFGVLSRAQLCVWSGSLALEGVKTWQGGYNTYLESVACAGVDKDGAIVIVTGGYYWDGMRDVAQLVVWTGSTLALEGVTTWYWVGETPIVSVACADVDKDGAIEIVTGGWYFDGLDNAQLCVWGFT